jgi:hypothetical protein
MYVRKHLFTRSSGEDLTKMKHVLAVLSCSVRYCQTPEVDKHSLSAIQELAAGVRLLVTHEAMYAIICHRRAVV